MYKTGQALLRNTQSACQHHRGDSEERAQQMKDYTFLHQAQDSILCPRIDESSRLPEFLNLPSQAKHTCYHAQSAGVLPLRIAQNLRARWKATAFLFATFFLQANLTGILQRARPAPEAREQCSVQT